MAHKYLSYITDQHLMFCIKNLHNSYLKAKANVSKSKFYKIRLIQLN